MRPLRTRLLDARRRLGIPWEVLERDYVLSWVLVGISQTPTLRDTLAFKGGTALRKCYFEDYRFSEDLDFTGMGDVPQGKDLERLVREACVVAEDSMDAYAPVAISCERYTEREPHPGGQEAFAIRARLPWHSRPQTRILVEVTVDEPVLWPTERRKIIHDFGEVLDAGIQVYALEEVVAEKLPAILQQIDSLERRGWSRSRGRDYYDLWRVLGAYRDRMDLTDFSHLLSKKCAVRGVSFAGPGDFFDGRMLSDVRGTWEQWLGPLVPGLPSFETVLSQLRPQVEILVARTT